MKQLIELIGFIIFVYQAVSLGILLTATVIMRAKIIIVKASYDHWWGTYANRENYEIYWMIPFIGLKFNFYKWYEDRSSRYYVVFNKKNYMINDYEPFYMENLTKNESKKIAVDIAEREFGSGWSFSNDSQIKSHNHGYYRINEPVDIAIGKRREKREGA